MQKYTGNRFNQVFAIIGGNERKKSKGKTKFKLTAFIINNKTKIMEILKEG